ncbi:MAG: DUF2807 domain-containing protein [Defluviitaleaceae bacterium]|nr:DUF2807 domain-containing protein [Defluviitaleaceae bacterium]
MKRFILGLFALAVMVMVLAACGGGRDGVLIVRGSGDIVSQSFEHTGFSGVSAGGVYEVSFLRSDTYSVRIVTHENLFENITVDVNRNGVLVVGTRGGINFDGTAPRLYIEAPFLDYVNLSGAAVAYGWDDIRVDAFELNLSGSASVDLFLAVDRLHVNMSGSSNASLYGRVDVMEASLSGSSSFRGRELHVRDVLMSLSGSTRAYVYAGDYIDVRASGSSRLYYRGLPRLAQNTSGSARVNRID